MKGVSSSQMVVLGVGLTSLVLGGSVLATFGVFFVAFIDEFRWSHTVASTGFAIAWLLRAAFSPLSGMLYGLLGVRRTTFLGALLLAGALGLSMTIANQWQYVLYFGVLGAAGATVTSMSHSILIPRWFVARRGLAMGAVSTAYGLGPLIFYPLLTASIEAVGWRATFGAYGVVLVVFSVFALLVIREYPPQGLAAPARPDQRVAASGTADAPGWALSDVFRSHRFWAVFMMYIAGFLGYQMLIAHQVAHAEAAAFERTTAAAVFAFMGGLTAVGSLIGGWASDRFGREPVFFASSLLGAAGVVAFAALAMSAGSMTLLLAFAVMSGLGFGMRLPLVFTVAADIFMGPHFPRVMGVLGVATALGGFLGPMLAGIVYDVSQSYVVALALSAMAMTLSGALVWVVAPRKGALHGRVERVELVNA